MTFALSKIQPPQPRQGLLIARPGLEQRVLGALQGHRVVLVCAPAGYGKTALLVRAIAQLPPRHGAAWVSLDPGDDLRRLLECLLTALEAFDPPWRVAPEAIVATALQGDVRARQQAVDELVNALDACDLAHGVIVLDDLHHVEDEASGHFLQRLLERLGRRWTLVLASRHEPTFNLARIGAAGELTVLRQHDLQFTRDEVQALFAQPGEAGIDEAAASALHARTAGWAAGLRLALTGARGGSPGSAIDRQAFDFLTTEVLARIHPGLRGFLLETSVLHDLDEARCSALTGDSRAAAWLDDIERLGLFASVVDETTHTLRLHDLFREALQHRLRIERGSDAWAEMLARAAAVEPDPVRRVSVLLRAQRHQAAAAAMPAIGWQLLFQGGIPTLLRLCDQFPAPMAEASAEVQQVLGLARWHVWEVRAAERHFARAEALYAERGDAAGAGAVRGFRTITLLSQGRLQSAQPLVAALRGGADAGTVTATDAATVTATDAAVVTATDAAAVTAADGGDARLAALLAETWFAVECGEFDAVAPRFAALLDVLEAENRIELWWLVIPSPRIAACRGMGPLLGRWAAGVMAATGEQPLPLHTLALLALGWQALWQGRIDEAAAHLQRADASASWTGQHVIARSHSLALRALLQALRGEAAEALALARDRVEGFPATYGAWGQWQMLFFAGKIAALCGDFEALRGWLQRLEALATSMAEIRPEQLQPRLGLHGALAWHEGREADAEAHWRAALEDEEHADLFGQASELRVRLAVARARRGAPAEAAAWLQPLLATAAPAPRGAVFAADALRELAAADWQAHLGDGAIDTLRRWAALLCPAPSTTPVKTTANVATPRVALNAAAPAANAESGSAVFGPLTAREAEVLALVARGQSNKVIARELDLSPHTVKRHVANLLDKLALASRSQASAWYHAQASGVRRG